MVKAAYASPILGPDGKPYRRQAFGNSTRALRAKYDAAQTTPNNRKHWSAADLLSAREANSPQVRATLRSRSRYECHEANSFAAGMIGSLANDTIGRGPRLQLELPNAEHKVAVESQFGRWCRAVNLAGKLQTAHRAWVVDGESFISTSTNNRLRNDVKLDLHLTECDQISSPYGIAESYQSPNYVDGIVIDDYGNPQTYHRLKSHPGDTFGSGLNEKTDIDAGDMIHLFRRDRPGQMRGIPWLTTSLPLFAVLRRYTLAVLAAAESVASFGGVIYTDSPQATPASVDEMDEIELELRSFLTLPEGWKMGQLKAEQPTTVYEMFRNAVMMEIARCIHMPLFKAIGSSAGYNYASVRMDLQAYIAAIKVIRHQYEVECLDRIFDMWLDEAFLIPGYLPALPAMRYGIPHSWMWDEPEHVDPSKVASSVETLWNLGLLSDEEYHLSRGVDPDEHYARMERQTANRSRLGLILPGFLPRSAPVPDEEEEQANA